MWEPDLSFTGCQNPAAGRGCASAQAVRVKVWMQWCFLNSNPPRMGDVKHNAGWDVFGWKRFWGKPGSAQGYRSSLQSIISWDLQSKELCPTALTDICISSEVKPERWQLNAGYQEKCSGCGVCPEEPSKLKDDTRNFLRALFFFVQSRNLPNFSDAYRNNQLLHSMTNVVYV